MRSFIGVAPAREPVLILDDVHDLNGLVVSKEGIEGKRVREEWGCRRQDDSDRRPFLVGMLPLEMA
jgi:hypothetical protein